jgi:cation transport ATPase
MMTLVSLALVVAFAASLDERVTESGSKNDLLAELRVGDVVRVRPGSRVPAEGTVLEGTADVDGPTNIVALNAQLPRRVELAH